MMEPIYKTHELSGDVSLFTTVPKMWLNNTLQRTSADSLSKRQALRNVTNSRTLREAKRCSTPDTFKRVVWDLSCYRGVWSLLSGLLFAWAAWSHTRRKANQAEVDSGFHLGLELFSVTEHCCCVVIWAESQGPWWVSLRLLEPSSMVLWKLKQIPT